MFEHGNICMIFLKDGTIKFARNMADFCEKKSLYGGKIKRLDSVHPSVREKGPYL